MGAGSLKFGCLVRNKLRRKLRILSALVLILILNPGFFDLEFWKPNINFKNLSVY